MSQKTKIFSHESPEYLEKWNSMDFGKYNGAYYYSQEIVKNIIPNVDTDYNWVTINIKGCCYDHSIVFIHSNVDWDAKYGWLADFKDLILVCSAWETYEYMKKYGKTIFLPLSVDVPYVKSFATDEQKDDTPCYCGNRWSFKENDLRIYLPYSYMQLNQMPREEMLRQLARYKYVYAIGRCAIEAKILGAEIRVCDHRYPDPEFWKVIDNHDAAKMLQEQLDALKGEG